MTPFRLRDLLAGLAVAGLALATVFCGFTLALGERGQRTLQVLPASATPIPPTVPVIPPTPTTNATQPSARPSADAAAITPVASDTATPEPTTALCTPPTGWLPVEIAEGDTLDQFATASGVSAELLQQANCLTSPELTPGNVLFVPPPTLAPTEPPSSSGSSPATPTCGPPAAWAGNIHVVQPGENLFRIALRYRTTVADLRQANCLPSIDIRAGQRLFVPPLPATATPSATPTPDAARATAVPTTGATLTLPRIAYDSCTYLDSNGDGVAENYRCLAILTIPNGQAPWTVMVDGAGNPGPFTFAAADDKNFFIIGRRCADAFYTVHVVDATGASATLPTGFLPANYAIFPPTGTNTCSVP